MRFFLMGFMGSGKSSAGKKLASLLNMDFYDLDDFISNEENRSIPELFAEGEEQFRKTESENLQKLILTHNNCVVALGGGTPCFNNNMEVIREHGKSIYFELTEEALYSRLVGQRSGRPLISDLNETELKSFIHTTLQNRLPFYTQADFAINALDLKGSKLKELAHQLSQVKTT